MSDTQKKFYLTTPIYYVNARPHIGHAYTTIAADVIARRHRLLGDDTFLLTGTDEHGQKIERSAAAAGIPPQQFADQVSASFEGLWQRMGITHDKFIRTTDEAHKRGVQKLFVLLQKNGFIELRSYTGQYCISDETFVDVHVGAPCPECGRITETVTEQNYFFKLSSFQSQLIDLIESNTLAIQPDSRRNEVLSFVKGGLKDLSISRTSFKWGIPVPGDETHVIYVWLDALANYMTAIGYGSEDPAEIERFERYWPADLHLVGKEIIRFHCVYWPAFLLAANLPLPKAITAHGWLLFEDSKMSKSRGNIVRTETILDAFGSLLPRPSEPSGVTEPSSSINELLSESDRKGTPSGVTELSSSINKQFSESNRKGTPSGVTEPSSSINEQFSDPNRKGTPSGVPQTSIHEKGALAPGLSDDAWKQQQDLFAADILRYFLLREIPFGQDGSFSFDALVQRYNSDLANGYGNLVSRTLTMIETFLQGESCKHPMLTKQVFPIGSSLIREPLSFEPNDLTKTSTTILSYIASLDRHLSEKAPWKLAKKDDEQSRFDLEEVLYGVAESIRIITALLYPILPYATASVWAQLGLGDIELAARNGELKNLQWGGLKPGTKLGPLSPIFPRAPKELIQTMIDAEINNAPTPSKLIDEKTINAAPIPDDPTNPAAGPRTASFSEENPGAHVAASAALTTERPGTPPHTEAHASGIFATSAAASAIPDTPQIAIDDFVKVDLRVAKIIVAERIPKADKLLRLEVDLGYEKRQILSGIAEWYTPEELLGRKIVVITNLAPRKMRGLESHGMLLAASAGDNTKPILATFGEDIELGSRLR